MVNGIGANGAGHSIEVPLRATALAAIPHTLVGAKVWIDIEEPRARFSLRVRVSASAAALASPASMLLPMPINSCMATGSRIVARLGPDEWLLSCREASAEQISADFTQALKATTFSMTDVGHRNVSFLVHGEHAREVINGGCPLDLSDARFPPGSATRTVFGKAEIVLMRPGPAPAYQVECWRSFAPYVYALLRHGVREFSGS